MQTIKTILIINDLPPFWMVMTIQCDQEFVFLYRNLCTRRESSLLLLAMEYENEIKKKRRTGPTGENSYSFFMSHSFVKFTNHNWMIQQ